MSARQLQDLLSSVVKLPAAAGHSAVSSAPNAVNLAAARRSPTVSAFGCSDRRCHLSRHRHRHNSSSSDLVYFSPVGGGGGGGGGGEEDEEGYVEAGGEDDGAEDGYYNHVDMYGRVVEEGEATPAQGRNGLSTGGQFN